MFRYCIIINQGKLLVSMERTWQPVDSEFLKRLQLTQRHHHYVGEYLGQSCHAVAIEETDASIHVKHLGFEWHSLRSQIGLISDGLFRLAARALQLVDWFDNHRFCGRCGLPTQRVRKESAMVCKACHIHYYPRIAPCVIGLITRGDHCLLARNIRFPDGYYSALAGFIEPGESAEQAFMREVDEEVSLCVGNMHYFGSQPWPFPSQLMLAYFAEYRSGDIQVDGQEIVAADWFHPNELPLTPPPSTISGQLIQQFVQQVQHSS